MTNHSILSSKHTLFLALLVLLLPSLACTPSTPTTEADTNDQAVNAANIADDKPGDKNGDAANIGDAKPSDSDSDAANIADDKPGDKDGNAANIADDKSGNDNTLAVNITNPLEPLNEEQIALLNAITPDPAPEELDAIKEEHRNKHFLTSDERHPELFRQSLEKLGSDGVYIGIGTDQGYVFTGFMKPAIAFLVDYDPWVILVHKIYLAFINICENRACLYEHFDNREMGIAALKQFYATHPRQSDIVKVYRQAQRGIRMRLAVLRRDMRKLGVKTFINDDEAYQFIRTLALNGRIVTFQANLLGDKAFPSMAQACKQLNLKVGALYLSNAEQYWLYNDTFKQNMLGLPYGDSAFIMRTAATKPKNRDYRYSIQPADIFKAWLQSPEGTSVRKITTPKYVRRPNQFPFSVDTKMPPMPQS